VADNEKITLDIPVVDLGQIDVLVEQGFYSNRADFFRISLRNQLDKYSEEVRQTITRRSYVVGIIRHGISSLQKVKEEGVKLDIRSVGMLIISEDVPVKLAQETINSIIVYGVFRASEDLKQTLADRISAKWE
jgi:Arc/MetJ-type ribon-helix-helix transcriptional regulator